MFVAAAVFVPAFVSAAALVSAAAFCSAAPASASVQPLRVVSAAVFAVASASVLCFANASCIFLRSVRVCVCACVPLLPPLLILFVLSSVEFRHCSRGSNC